MRKINNYIYEWLVHTYEPGLRDVALYRIFYCLSLIWLGLPQFSEIAAKEAVFFNPPPGISLIIGPIFDEWFWFVFDRMVEITFFLLFVGYRTKFISFLFGGLMIFGHTYLYSFGKIDHNIYINAIPFLMAFSGWGGAYSVDAEIRKVQVKPQGWPLVYLAFLLGVGYLTAAVPKILGGWLNYDELMSKGILFVKHYYHGNRAYLSEFFVNINNPLIYKLMDYGTLLFESFFIVSILKVKWFHKAIVAAALFHFGVLISLDISFHSHMITLIPYVLIHFNVGDLFHSFLMNKTLRYVVICGMLFFLTGSWFFSVGYADLRSDIYVIFATCVVALMIIPKRYLYIKKS